MKYIVNIVVMVIAMNHYDTDVNDMYAFVSVRLNLV